MKWLKRFLLLLVLAGIIGYVAYLVWHKKPIDVAVKKTSRGKITSTVVNTRAGTVKACRRAQLSPAIGGQIATWPVHEGMQVHQGDLLLALWNQDLRAQLALAQSETEAAVSKAEAICLQADIAARQAERYQALQGAAAITEEKLDQLNTEKEATRADCKAARVTVKVNRDRTAFAKANLEHTYLRAPFDGTIADLNGELGEYVTPSPIGVQTLPTVDLIDTSCFYVSAPIDEVDTARIRVGMETRITLDAFRDRVFAGKVRRIADFVLDLEKQARTVEIEVEFTSPEEIVDLLPGYSADAEVILEEKEHVLRVPSEAILEGNKVYVLLPGGSQVELRKIETGLSNWDYTEALAGLAADESVVVTIDRPGLEDGAVVKVEEQHGD